MPSTADFLPIQDVRDNLVLLKNGDIALILETSAVNFGLLSANEQLAIISSFAGLLNSLNFSIQIVIRSKRLDITDYLKVLDSAYQRQTNPLLANMMIRYRKFIETTVRENEVLDKQFFVVVSISYYEMGLSRAKEPDMKAAMTLLLPRRDHIIRQLSRIGLKANQLNTKQIVQLFYDIYNFDPNAPSDNFNSTENAMNLVKQAEVGQAVSQQAPADAVVGGQVGSSTPEEVVQTAIDNQKTEAVISAGVPAFSPNVEQNPALENQQSQPSVSGLGQPFVRQLADQGVPPFGMTQGVPPFGMTQGVPPFGMTQGVPPGRVNLPFVAEELKEEI